MSEPPAPGRALQLSIVFRVSGGRNRSTLWKPAIDALGPLLGAHHPTRLYQPPDDRIVELAYRWGEAAAPEGGRTVRASAGGGR
ncbi:hypothetical protein [Kitasatospora sp. KL5]|uniref:hypothetical protein n=1 Tax=Kitasatospora sp. KL5 TaxID=3425125 RepID=UPI003D6F3F3F